MTDAMHTPRATAFSIAFQPNRGAQKPKPKKGPFPFLQRHQGHLASEVAATSPHEDLHDSTEHRPVDSRSLREAIANDMRKARHHDPFETAQVAVPKRAPPPNRSEQQQQQQPAPQQQEVASAKGRGKNQEQAMEQKEEQQAAKPTSRRKPDWDTSGAKDAGGDDNADFEAERPVQSGKREPPPSRAQQAPSARKHHQTSILDEEDEEQQDADDRDAVVPKQQNRTGRAAEDYPPSRGGRAGEERLQRLDDQRRDDPREQRGAYRSQPIERRERPDPYAHNTRRRRVDELDADSGASEDADDVQGGGSHLNHRQNFFSKAKDVRKYRGDPSMAETELVEQLEDELRQARAERQECAALKQKLERDRQRFQELKYKEEQRLQQEREDLEATAEEEKRAIRRENKVLEDKNKQLSQQLHAEKENARRAQHENDALREQLERITGQLRDAQRQHKVEAERLRSDIAALTNRNAELLDMVRQQQANDLTSRQRRDVTESQPSVHQPSDSRTSSTHSDVRYQIEEGGRGGSSDAEGEEEEDYREQHKLQAQRERRAREIEERLRAEEEERQSRKAQKEREKALQKQREEEAARQREEAKLREEERLQKLKEERRRAENEKRLAEEERKRRQEEAEKQRVERRSAGHPPNTPRNGQQPLSTLGQQQQPTTGSALPPGLPPQPGSSRLTQRRRIPTAEELVNDTEPMPSEDIPNDAVVSMPPAGDASNKREILYRSGKRETLYSNGTKKVVLRSGHVVLYFTNGDVKRSFPSGKSTYWYAVAQTLHTQLPDGVQIFQFESSGQTERHRPDGTKEILYPDGIFKTIREDGQQETVFPDGTVQVS